MITKRFPLSLSLLALLVPGVLYIGACSDPSSSGSNRLPSFPYPDGGPSAVDAPWFPSPDGPAPEIAVRADTATPDVPLLSDRPSPDVPIADVQFALDGKACPASCDDNNPCTVDSCDTTVGACVNTQADEGSACTYACLAGGQGLCKFGVCTGTPAPDGTTCSDQNPCTVGDSCKNGLCFSGPPMPCPAIDICHEAGHCEPATGACSTPKSTDGKTCDDGLACTTGDQCGDGKCAGTPLACATSASCEIATGICKSPGDRTAFPSATLSVRLPNVLLDSTGGLAQDKEGNLYLVGSTSETINLGSGPQTPAGVPTDAGSKKTSDVFVAKIDPATGKATWTSLFGDPMDQSGWAIAVNQKGQAVVSGGFKGSVTFGGTTITNPTAEITRPFVGAVDTATGAGLWALWPQTKPGAKGAVAADPMSSDFVVCSVASETGAIGLVPLAGSPDQDDIVVARLDARTGIPVWGRQISGPGIQTCDGVTVDSAGHVFLAGTMTSLPSGANDDAGVRELDLGSGHQLDVPVRAGGAAKVIWVAKLDVETGSTLAATRFDAQNGGVQTVQQIACDAAGNLLLAGGIKNPGVAGTLKLTAGSVRNALLVKLDAQLAPLWADAWGGAKDTLATLVASAPAGAVVVAGTYTDELDLDGIALARGSGASAFVASIDGSSGTVLAARGYGASAGEQTGAQTTWGLQVMTSGGDVGGIWLAGMFTGMLQLGPPAADLTGTVGTVGFLGRIAP